MYKSLLLCKIIIAILVIQVQTNMQKVILPESTGAKCSDGQPSGYFVQQPLNNMKSTKFLLDFFPVGWCSHEDNNENFLGGCFDRSTSYPGSLDLQEKHINRWHFNQGMHSQQSHLNPHFQDWVFILISSCDGALGQGYSKDPYLYKNKELWFRGENTTKASLNDAWERYGLKNATEVLIMGGSSGGLTAILWSNYIRDMFPNTTKMWTYADSSFYVDYLHVITGKYRLRQQMIDILTYANVEVDPINKECIDDNPDEKWKCLLAEYAVLYLKTPLFLSQFDYDAWMMYNQLGIPCENLNVGYGKCIKYSNKVNDKVEVWKDYVVEKIESTLNYKQGNYYWRLPCFYHCVHFDNIVFNNKADFSYNFQTISEALFTWMYQNDQPK